MGKSGGRQWRRRQQRQRSTPKEGQRTSHSLYSNEPAVCSKRFVSKLNNNHLEHESGKPDDIWLNPSTLGGPWT